MYILFKVSLPSIRSLLPSVFLFCFDLLLSSPDWHSTVVLSVSHLYTPLQDVSRLYGLTLRLLPLRSHTQPYKPWCLLRPMWGVPFLKPSISFLIVSLLTSLSYILHYSKTFLLHQSKFTSVPVSPTYNHWNGFIELSFRILELFSINQKNCHDKKSTCLFLQSSENKLT